MEKEIIIENFDRKENSVQIKLSETYIEMLKDTLKIKYLNKQILSDFIRERLCLVDRIDYGYLDCTILPPITRMPIIILNRNTSKLHGIRNADFVLFMELMIAGELEPIRNIGKIRRNWLINSYKILFYNSIIYTDLVRMAQEFINDSDLPDKISTSNLMGVLDDFGDKYNLI